VTPPRGERRETVLDGLRFATGTETTAAGGRRVVVIDRSRTPSPEMLRAIGGALECSLDVAESLLFAPLARSPDAIRFARGYLEWLAEIWNGDERRRDLRIHALYLARAAGCFPRERAFPREYSGVLGEDRSAILDAATRLQGLWSHIVMWFRERRLRDLEAEASPDARATVRMIEDFTSGMRTMGDRLADVLGRIGERQVENLATRAASLRELEGRAESALDGVLAAAEEIGSDPADHEAWSHGCVLLRATADLLAPVAPEKGDARPPGGDDPIAEARLFLFRVRQASTAALALELLGKPDGHRSAPRVERLLDALDGPVELPSRAEWDRLPRLVAGCFDCSLPRDRIVKLEAALMTLASASAPWFERRLTAARLGAFFAGLRTARSAEGREIGGDAMEASPALQLQQRRVTRLLILAWNLLLPAGEAEGPARPTGLSTLDLAEIAHALRAARES
jgi:hypothetical protein